MPGLSPKQQQTINYLMQSQDPFNGANNQDARRSYSQGLSQALLGAVPGSGAAGALGYYPDYGKNYLVPQSIERGPSIKDNLDQGNMMAAALQGIGLLPDVGYAATLGSMVPKSAQRGMADYFGPMDRTKTGWTFKDVQKKPNLTKEENRFYNNFFPEGETVELPIRSIIATQEKVNPDFSAPASINTNLPTVVKKEGLYYLYDGHHRLTSIANEGGQRAKVKLIDFDKTDRSAPLIDYIKNPTKNKITKADIDYLLNELGFGSGT